MNKFLLVLLAISVLIPIYSLFLSPKSIEEYIKEEKLSGRASDISVFIERLNSDISLGVFENDAFIPASLTKVPFMMSILKRAEKDPTLLGQKILYIEMMDEKYKGYPNYPPVKEEMRVGERYTVGDLLNRMIKYSDNDALAALLSYFPSNDDVLQVSGISQKEIKKQGESVYFSPKTFSKIFKTLYSEKYLNHEMNEKALSILTDTEFHVGMEAGLPKGVRFAHKYGVNVASFSKGLNECGIVFLKSPYLICVMTNGKEYADLEDILKTISAMAYKKFAREI